MSNLVQRSIHLMPILTNESVKNYVESHGNLMSRKEYDNYPGLYVLKYKRKVFYKNLWDSFLENFRGTVVDAEYNPVVMPFQKIYNRNENGTDIDRKEFVVAVEKVNGFMAAATYVPHLKEVIVSTTGSLESEYVDLAKKYLSSETLEVIAETGVIAELEKQPQQTFLFEICAEEDPHVIKETPGVYLIGSRSVEWEGCICPEDVLNMYATMMDVKRPKWFFSRFGVVARKTKYAQHEGYVVHGEETSLKLKSPYYLCTKFFGRKTQEKLEKLLTQEGYAGIHIDEEFYPLVDHLRTIKETFKNLSEQQRFELVRNWLTKRLETK